MEQIVFTGIRPLYSSSKKNPNEIRIRITEINKIKLVGMPAGKKYRKIYFEFYGQDKYFRRQEYESMLEYMPAT